MKLTEYLFHRLRELGVGCTFGIPGDFVLPVYAVQEEVGMPTVVCAHEPGVGFAADAYARFRGLGVALVTYGPGALNTLNPVACAYAEQSPLLVVSGGPEVALRRPDLNLHHVIKTFESQLQIYREVTVDAAILDDPASAPETIDRVLRERGRVEATRDIWRSRATGSRSRSPTRPARCWSGRMRRRPRPSPARSTRPWGRSWPCSRAASRPALYVGVGIRRHGLTEAVVRLAERLGVPVVTDLLGKAAFPESHPQFAGVYLGGPGRARRPFAAGRVRLRAGDRRRGHRPRHRVLDPAHPAEVPRDDRRGQRAGAVSPLRRPADRRCGRGTAGAIAPRPGRTGRGTRRGASPRMASRIPDRTGMTASPAGLLRVAEVIDVLRGLDQSRYSFVDGRRR